VDVRSLDGGLVARLDSAWLRGVNPSAHFNVNGVEWFAEGSMVVCGSSPQEGTGAWVWSIHSTTPARLPAQSCVTDAR
jgi:hypothetical protein